MNLPDPLILPHSQESAYSYLNKHLETMAKDPANLDQLTSGLHVWPDFHGNRSPLADPTLKGMVSERDISLMILSIHTPQWIGQEMHHTHQTKLSVCSHFDISHVSIVT